MRWLQHHVRPEQIELSLLFLILVAILVFGSLIDGYYTSRTFNRIASSVAIITVVAVGQTLVVLTRNIDLSVGSIVGCTAYFVGTQIAAHPGTVAGLAVLIAVALGAAMGVINGAIVATKGRVPSIIVTLGTLAIYRGLLIDYSGAKTVTTASLPAWIVELPRIRFHRRRPGDRGDGGARARDRPAPRSLRDRVSELRPSLLCDRLKPGRSRLVGLPTRQIVFAAFLVSGALSGLAGFMTLARFGTITVENTIRTGAAGRRRRRGRRGQHLWRLGHGRRDARRRYDRPRWSRACSGCRSTSSGSMPCSACSFLLAVASDTLILRRLRALWARRELAGCGKRRRKRASGPSSGAMRRRRRGPARYSRAGEAGKRLHFRLNGAPRRLLDVIEMDRHFLGRLIGVPGGNAPRPASAFLVTDDPAPDEPEHRRSRAPDRGHVPPFPAHVAVHGGQPDNREPPSERC